MTSISKEEKRGLKIKFLEFKKSGLSSYRAYLQKEYENSEGKSHKEAYFKYIKKELEDNAKRLKKVDKKLDK